MGDFENDVPVGEFLDELTERAKSDFVDEHNAGIDLMQAYEKAQDNSFSFDAVKIMLDEMKKIHSRFDFNRFVNRRT